MNKHHLGNASPSADLDASAAFFKAASSAFFAAFSSALTLAAASSITFYAAKSSALTLLAPVSFSTNKTSKTPKKSSGHA